MLVFVVVFFVGVAGADFFGLVEVLEVVRVWRFWGWYYPVLFTPKLVRKYTFTTNPKQSKKTRSP
jgi:hypothetical protein